MSLVNTLMVNMRAQGNLDKWVYRPSRYGALDAYMQMGEDPNGILTPDLRMKAEESMGRTLQVPVIQYDSGVTIGNTRTLTISDDLNTSALQTITFATYAWGFTIAPMAHKNNEISMEREFQTQMTKYINKFAETLDTAALASLATNRNQVFNEKLIYNIVGNQVEATWNERDQIIGDIDPIMSANDFYGDYHLVGNVGLMSIARKLDEQGLYNDRDKRIQFLDKTLHFTNRLQNQKFDYATFYAINSGSLGMLTRFEPDAINNTISRTGHEWGVETLPMLNMPVGTYYYEDVENESSRFGAATSHLSRTLVRHFGFAVDVAFITPYNQDLSTYSSPIARFTINEQQTS
jgi:hypothetical protein